MCMENWGRELAIRASDGKSARASERGRIIAVLFLPRLQFLPCKIETEEHNHCKIFQLTVKSVQYIDYFTRKIF